MKPFWKYARISLMVAIGIFVFGNVVGFLTGSHEAMGTTFTASTMTPDQMPTLLELRIRFPVHLAILALVIAPLVTAVLTHGPGVQDLDEEPAAA